MIRTFALAALSLVLACGAGDREDSAQPAEHSGDSTLAAPDTSRRTLAEFQALRYVEGDWRGSGYAGGPFFERYHFVNDSTIEMTAWTDSTLTTPAERKQYMLRDGIIQTDDGGRLVRVDADGHHFQRGSSRWTFRQVSSDRWTARVGPSTIYTMDRIASR